MEVLAEAGVSARRGIMAAHRQPAYADRDTGTASLAVTERLTDNTLILPLFHELTDAEQLRVVDALRTAASLRSAGTERGAA
jgi:dTDP-4-amino-4,6-dideoxygalactose transaminase